MTGTPLILGVPSKGRMRDDCLRLLTDCGYTPEDTEGRSYRSRLIGRDDIEVHFLPAAIIARELFAGSVHLGITGEDLVREATSSSDIIECVLPLGFGRADVVVAVPRAWIDVTTMSDLEDIASRYRSNYGRRLRVATKYWRLTRDHFRAHGVGVYRIVESLGATEGAPSSGQADAIVDITSSGATLEANNLRVLTDGLILSSEANLAKSHRASWDDATRSVADEIANNLKKKGS